jgi:hypothetical protein
MKAARFSIAAALAAAISTVALAQTGATQAPITKATAIRASVTIQAIDATTRTVTLRNEKGEEEKFIVGPDIRRFDELKVGDKLNVTYYESMVFQLRKPGEPSNKAAETAAFTAAKSKLPAGTVATQTTLTVTVKAIDPAVPSITVTTADGRTVTRKIEDKKNIEGVKVGDRIDITYTEAVLLSIERGK